MNGFLYIVAAKCRFLRAGSPKSAMTLAVWASEAA
jgi:hypothetical protein